MPDSRSRLAVTLRGLREDHTLDNQSQLARKLRVSVKTVRAAENGAYIPGRQVLRAYARVFAGFIDDDELAHLRTLAIRQRDRRNGKPDG